MIIHTVENEGRLSNEMVSLLCKQIAHELANHNLYKTFSLYFSKQGLMKLSSYYNKRAEEELNHSNWIFSYLEDNDIFEKYPTVIEITAEIDDFVTPFKLTLDKEIETTNMIYKIVELAQTEKEWITFNWLMSKLVPEQLEEEKKSKAILNLANCDTDWLTKQDSILEYYGG